jgi:hypothetical protein
MRGQLERLLVSGTLHPLEHCVTDDLELLIAEMARHQAHHHQCSLAEATRQIRALVAAREEYRAADAPYGDDDQGFCRWLLAKPRLTPSAYLCHQNEEIARTRAPP